MAEKHMEVGLQPDFDTALDFYNSELGDVKAVVII